MSEVEWWVDGFGVQRVRMIQRATRRRPVMRAAGGDAAMFITLHDIAALLGVTIDRARRVALGADFPTPLSNTPGRAGYRWHRDDIERWVEMHRA